MAGSPKRARLVAEVALLRKQQVDCFENAAFVGWTTEAKADHEKRAERLELLVLRLAKLDMTISTMQKNRCNPAPDATENDFLQRLRQDVERQISTYVYQVPGGALGTPLKPDEIRSYLDEMRLCLVAPHWETVNISNNHDEIRTGNSVSRMCVTMAEDENYVLVFDPADQAYHLAWRSERGLGTWGIRGDAVGCFLAR